MEKSTLFPPKIIQRLFAPPRAPSIVCAIFSPIEEGSKQRARPARYIILSDYAQADNCYRGAQRVVSLQSSS